MTNPSFCKGADFTSTFRSIDLNYVLLPIDNNYQNIDFQGTLLKVIPTGIRLMSTFLRETLM